MMAAQMAGGGITITVGAGDVIPAQVDGLLQDMVQNN